MLYQSASAQHRRDFGSSEIFVIFHHWKSGKRKADFSSCKVFRVQVCCRAHPGIAEAQGTPPVCSRWSAKPVVQGRLAGGRPVPLRMSHTDTRTVAGKVRWRFRRRFRCHHHGGEAEERQQAIVASCHPRSAASPAPAAPAAQDSRSPLRNAFSDSRTPSRVARRVCSPRRTAPNFTRVLPRCRSRQVVHNASHTNSQVRFLADESTRTVASLLIRVRTLAKVLNRDTWSRRGAFPSTSLQLLTKASEISLSQGTGPRRGPRTTPAKP
ncbi:uncharacterized protein [Taeniopygia guttata]|uniref:uncharacterized protein n=1 Tax=Taeniopygia guttata TaxID=59729 RepID=UPI003BB990E1